MQRYKLIYTELSLLRRTAPARKNCTAKADEFQARPSVRQGRKFIGISGLPDHSPSYGMPESPGFPLRASQECSTSGADDTRESQQGKIVRPGRTTEMKGIICNGIKNDPEYCTAPDGKYPLPGSPERVQQVKGFKTAEVRFQAGLFQIRR
jgi:hypothetical protein